MAQKKKYFTCGVVLKEKDYKRLQIVAAESQPTTTVSAIVRMLISNYLKSKDKCNQ